MTPVLKFGPFELDRQNFELRRDGRSVKLDRTPLELLFLLAERRGSLVTREEAVDQIWGKGVFIEAETSLYTAIRKIRKALGDEIGEPQFIQTVSRKGYRFIAKVEENGELSGSSAAIPASVGRRRTAWVLWTIAACLLAIALAATWLRFSRHVYRPDKIMLVVLPLQNLSADAHQDYLADGITEEVITQVGKLDPKHLGVIARTSAMQYKHAQKDTAQIARELGVNYLLEGSIQRSANRLRITAQLIQASDQTHLWAESYDRDLGDVLKTESEIAGIVASEIRLTLSEQTHQRLANVTRVNPEAHDAYLRGLQGWNQRSREGLLEAVAEFGQATQLDPNYAPAYDGLARVYSLAPIFAGIPASEAAPKALEAANRALELDETLADAHSTLGFVKGHYQFDWPTAEQELRRAIELDPNNAYAHFFYSNSYLSPFGHHRDAIAEMEKAMEIDPLSPIFQSFAGRTFIWARRYNDAIAQFQKVNQLNPNFALNHERLAQLYALLANYGGAIEEETKARLMSGENPQEVLSKMNRLRQAFTDGGARGYWKQQLELVRNKPNPPEDYDRPFGLAMVYAQLRDNDRAMENLDIAYQQRDAQLTELAIDPQFDSLRADPRFVHLERQVGVAPK